MQRFRQAERFRFVIGAIALVLASANAFSGPPGFTEERRVPSPITRVRFWPDADHVIGTVSRRTVKVNLKTSQPVWTREPPSHGGMSMAMDPQGKRLVVLEGVRGGWEPKLIDVNSGKTIRTFQLVKNISKRSYCLAISPNGGTLAIAAGTDRKVLLIELPGGKPMGVIKTARQALSVAFSPDGRMLAVSGDGYPGFSIYDAKGRRKLKHITWDPKIGGTPIHLVFSPDNRLIAGFLQGQLWIWNLSTGRTLWRLKRIGIGLFGTLAFSPDGKWLAANGQWAVKPDNVYMSVRVWEARTGKVVATLTDLRHGNDGEMNFAFSPDGKRVAAVFDRVKPLAVTIWRWGPATGGDGKPGASQAGPSQAPPVKPKPPPPGKPPAAAGPKPTPPKPAPADEATRAQKELKYAKLLLTNAQTQLAVGKLKAIVKQFPGTEAAKEAQRLLARLE